jgi:hypothetical protein
MDTEQPEEAPMVGLGDLLAAAMDDLAIATHNDVSAADGHWQIAIHLWPVLKSLGYTRGDMISAGVDADLLAGRPPHPRHVHDPGRRIAFHAPVPSGTQWPHHDLPLTVVREDDDPRLYDLAIGNLPCYDVAFVKDTDRTDHGRYHRDLITFGLETTKPGGMMVALAGQSFLDHPDPDIRAQVVALGDLVGAIRLPSGALRPDSHADGPADVLLLRRRPPDAGPAGAGFAASREVEIGRARCHVNEYWLAHPEHVLGTLAPSEVDGITTVKPGSEHLGQAMQSAFTRIKDTALAEGMTAPDSGNAPPPAGASPPGGPASAPPGPRREDPKTGPSI